MKTLVLPILVLLPFASFCLAQTTKKIPVAVAQFGDDQVGRAMALALKEAISESQRLILVEHNSNRPRMSVFLHSVDTEVPKELKGRASAIAEVILYQSPQTPAGGIFITVNILICGIEQVENCAIRRLPQIYQAIDYLRTSWPGFWNAL
jgi:hypothetical protein